MGILIVIGFAVFCILFLVALVFSAWHWRWLNVVGMLLLFPAAVAFVIMFANMMEKNYKVRDSYHTAVSNLEKKQKETNELLYGAADETEWTPDSVTGLTHRLEKAALGRGRVWRDCVPGQINGGKVQVTTFVTNPDAPGGEEARVLANYIQVPSLVFVFAQGNPTPEGWSFPETYLGEFRVTAATDTTVTLEQSLLLDAGEINASLNRRWTLYELMPSDLHNVFEQAEAAEAGAETIALEYAAKRELLMNKYLTPASLNLPADSPEYLSLISRYAFDGEPLGTISQHDPNFAPTGDEILVRVEVIKDFNDAQSALDEKVDSDVKNNNIEQSRDYDEQGNAESEALKNNGPVEIRKGDELLVPLNTAVKGYSDASGNPRESWVDRGLVKEIERVYSRRLNDYGTIYHDVTLALELINQEIAFQEVNNTTQMQSEGLANSENDFRTKMRDQLEADNRNLKQDVATLDAALEKTTATFNANRKRLDELDESIEQATAKLASLEARWAREAEQKTLEATGFGLLSK